MSGGEIIIRQNRAIRAFKSAGAISPTRGKSLEELGIRRTFAINRLFAKGVIKPARLPEAAQPTETPTYYLDNDATLRFLRARRTRITIFMIAGLFVIVLIAIVTL